VKGWRFNNQVSYTSTADSANKGYFFRPTADVSKLLPKFGNYTIGFTYSIERSESRNRFTDTVNAASFSFEKHTGIAPVIGCQSQQMGPHVFYTHQQLSLWQITDQSRPQPECQFLR